MLTEHERADWKRKLAAAEQCGDEDAAFEAKVALGRVSAAERRAAAIEAVEVAEQQGESDPAKVVERDPAEVEQQARQTPPKGRSARPTAQQTADAQ